MRVGDHYVVATDVVVVVVVVVVVFWSGLCIHVGYETNNEKKRKK